MVSLRVVNPFSGRHEVVGEVTTADWASDSFWVPIFIHGNNGMVARRDLRLA